LRPARRLFKVQRVVKIVRIRARNIGFSRSPDTLRRHLVSNASRFDDFETKPGGWFGPVVCTLVEVEVDDGTVGIGTAGAFQGGALELIPSAYAELLLGEDPRRHEHLWQRMYQTTVRFGRSGPAVAAISALDIACWDLHGKAEGKPIVDLIGGRAQTRVPCYVSRLYALEDLDELAEEARTWARAGFTRMKQRFGFGPKDGLRGLRRNVELVETVRQAVGDDVELAADAYMGWDLGYAIEAARRLQRFELAWIEEPLMPHDLAGYAELKRRCPWQRWSCGEHSYTKWEFRQLIESRAVDILQPDVNRVGGITEALKVCALAETAGLPVVPHSNEAHNLHVVFSRPASVCPLVEYFPDGEPDTGNELFWKLFRGTPLAEEGTIGLPDAPGLGLEVNEEVAAELQVGEERVSRLQP
jgi:L-alanine-DL-glutamate epimerase-like enolase superfamily enzyme